MRKYLHPSNSNSILLKLIASIDTRDRSRNQSPDEEETGGLQRISRSVPIAGRGEEENGADGKENKSIERDLRFITIINFIKERHIIDYDNDNDNDDNYDCDSK